MPQHLRLILCDEDGTVIDEWDSSDEFDLALFQHLLEYGFSSTGPVDVALRAAIELAESEFNA